MVTSNLKKDLVFYSQKDVDLRVRIPDPQNMDIDNHLGKNKITFREGQTIYVSEPGLYA